MKNIASSPWPALPALAVALTASQAFAAPAFPGCEGYGCETQHGRGGTVCIVTNTNDSGAGSLRDCLLQTGPRIVIFRVSGMINLTSTIQMVEAQSNVAVFGQTAPGDGIEVSVQAEGAILSLGKVGTLTVEAESGADDVVFQHLRLRANSAVGNSASPT